MTARPAEWLRARGAQNDLVTWAEPFDDLDTLWRACPRGDWLLAIARTAGVENDALERAMLVVASLALDHVEDDARAATTALLEAPRTQRIEAAHTLDDRAASAESPALAAALGALAIALGARTDDAASVAALVAQAAVFDAGDCAMMPALSYAQKRSAELVREVIPSIA